MYADKCPYKHCSALSLNFALSGRRDYNTDKQSKMMLNSKAVFDFTLLINVISTNHSDTFIDNLGFDRGTATSVTLR